LLLWSAALVPVTHGQDHAPPVLEGGVLEAAAPNVGPETWLTPPYLARAQNLAETYAPPDPQVPIPTYSTRPENGGLYIGLQFLYYYETMPIKDQVIARRGFFDADGSISAALGGAGIPGTFVGSGRVALRANDLGQSQYMPGFEMFAGWKLRNGTTIEIDWIHLDKVKYAGGAGIIPFLFRNGPNLEETFLTAPVFNFDNNFAGPPQKVAVGNAGATFGIWNAASDMFIQFTQRYDQYDIQGRVPIWQTDNNRCYGICGFRNCFLVEKYTWRTVSEDISGNASALDVAIYNNNVTNNMFGPVCGCGDEWRIGDSPLGTFALQCDFRAALMVDFVREYTKYERGDGEVGSKEQRRTTSIVPELQFTPTLAYYPIEGVQLKVAYDLFWLFNTLSSPYPVSFNYQGLDPALHHEIRYFNGFKAGLAFIF
jgi:hypothetical protein